MNKFKVGNKVTLIADISSVYLKHNREYVVDKVFDDKLFVQGVDFKYDSNIFELVKESVMSKFKVGDKVVRVSETYGKAIKGGVYEVSGVSDSEWAGSCGINLEGHECESGKFNYEASCFELYDDSILSPLEAAEALLKGDELEVITTKKGEWQPLDKHQNSVTVKNIKYWKFRHKPKTILINGVEVPAPVELPRYTEGYTPSLCHREVQTACAGKGRIMWATEEDAQKALDAMLIPFKENNND